MEAEVCFNQGDILNAEIALDKAMLLCDKYSGVLCCALFLKLRILIHEGKYEEFRTLMDEIEMCIRDSSRCTLYITTG